MSALLRMPEDQTIYTVYGSMNLGPPVAIADFGRCVRDKISGS